MKIYVVSCLGTVSATYDRRKAADVLMKMLKDDDFDATADERRKLGEWLESNENDHRMCSYKKLGDGCWTYGFSWITQAELV